MTLLSRLLGNMCLACAVWLVWLYGDLYSLGVGVFIGGLGMLVWRPEAAPPVCGVPTHEEQELKDASH